MLFSKVLFFLRFSIEYKPKGCYVSGRFVPTDVLSARCFVPPEVLSLRTFCPTDVMSPADVSGRFFSECFVPTDVLSPDVLSLWMFCLRTFCPYGCFVSGRFAWVPVKHHTSSNQCKNLKVHILVPFGIWTILGGGGARSYAFRSTVIALMCIIKHSYISYSRYQYRYGCFI
jgi:hypothetical protein